MIIGSRAQLVRQEVEGHRPERDDLRARGVGEPLSAPTRGYPIVRGVFRSRPEPPRRLFTPTPNKVMSQNYKSFASISHSFAAISQPFRTVSQPFRSHFAAISHSFAAISQPFRSVSQRFADSQRFASVSRVHSCFAPFRTISRPFRGSFAAISREFRKVSQPFRKVSQPSHHLLHTISQRFASISQPFRRFRIYDFATVTG